MIKEKSYVYVKDRNLLKKSFRTWLPCQVFQVANMDKVRVCNPGKKPSKVWHVWLEMNSKAIPMNKVVLASKDQIKQYKLEKKKKLKIDGATIPRHVPVYQTGYFANERYNSCVHITKDGKSLCGYQPAKSMGFQWNANHVAWEYVECERCKTKFRDSEDFKKKHPEAPSILNADKRLTDDQVMDFVKKVTQFPYVHFPGCTTLKSKLNHYKKTFA